jgi:hypothetical protein
LAKVNLVCINEIAAINKYWISGTLEGNYLKSCGKKYFISTLKVLLIFIIDGVEYIELIFSLTGEMQNQHVVA